MLSQEDRQRLEEIERQLQADDPRFVARMRSSRQRPEVTTVVLLFLWSIAVGVAIVSRSVLLMAALFAIILIEAGWRLYRRRHPA